jgi:hypothetical protein
MQRRRDAGVCEVWLGMHETRDGAGVAIARRQDDGRSARVLQLRSVRRVRKKGDGIGCGASERAYALDDDLGVADELTPELRRELTQGRGHR